MAKWFATRLTRILQASHGLWVALNREVHIKLHAMAMVGWVGMGLWVEWDALAWALMCLGFAMVGAIELLNTALECMVDAWCQDPSPVAKQIKDVAAGAVLWVVALVTIMASLLLYRQVIA